MSLPRYQRFNLEDEVSLALKSVIPDSYLKEMPLDLEHMMNSGSPEATIIVCGLEKNNFSLVEVAQCARLAYPAGYIVLATTKKLPVKKKDLQKNGFDDVFYFPLEQDLFIQTIASIKTSIEQGTESPLVQIKVCDVLNLKTVDFQLYIHLAANNRYVPLNAGSDELGEKKKNRLMEDNIGSVYVEEKDLPSFYRSYAEHIKSIQKSDALSETEKKNLLRNIVRELISDISTEENSGMNSSLKFSETCRQIINSYIEDGKDGQRWISKISLAASQGNDFFCHASDNMITTTLLGIGLQLEEKSINALALAALLHDVGHAQIPRALLDKNESELTVEEQKIFSQHPKHAIEIMKQKKVIVPDLTHRIILQHHENYDGTGYPQQLAGKQLLPESQILHFADLLLDSLKVMPGVARISFLQAVQNLKKNFVDNPARQIIDPNLLKEIIDLIEDPSSIEKKEKKISSGTWSMTG